MNRFSDKIVLITGGSTGIGLATALAFAREGATPVIASRRADEGEKIIALLQAQGAKASFFQTDVTVEAEVRRLFEQIMARYGRLDIAFNNAGYEGTRSPVHELHETDWDATINANLKGTWLSMKYEIQQMLVQGSGVIVNMAANLAYIGLPQMGAYSAAKAGILALTRVAALETIRSGVRINAVSPGSVGTPMAERLFGSLENQQRMRGSLMPIGRVGTPEEVATAVLWLSSPEASFVVGQDIVIDGGLIIQ
ncbi:short chain dehydrogenase [Tengunoibacter tsumagoiensis]|uniref:Short chain dehydrogenase n=2 Tax=Tengunoibacter tsumagoiensis TaxID=2014871 RepID=A0A401ZVH1_9CHLR|nr:short chain dehydrogenase [Tengunoibacter tsumagoiensis]